jgi:hypothetical protein
MLDQSSFEKWQIRFYMEALLIKFILCPTVWYFLFITLISDR